MSITPLPPGPAASEWPALQSPAVGSQLPGLQTAARANLIFIAAAPELIGAYSSFLRDEGYSVSVAADVSDASTQAEALCPDIVFLDLGESSEAGLAMLRELKADACLGAIPLVLLASFDSLDDVHAGLKLGARDYIIKTETSPTALARGLPGWARIELVGTSKN